VILLACLVIAPWIMAQQMSFDVYTLKQDSTVRLGYPKGWTVTEQPAGGGILGAVIQEKQTADSAGIMAFVIPIAQGVQIQNSKELTEALLGSLRQESLPDLTVVGQQPHSQAPQVLVTEIAASSGGISFQGRVWCALAPVKQNLKLGVFAMFYVPQTRSAAFNADQILASTLAPIFATGSQPDRGAGAETTEKLPVTTSRSTGGPLSAGAGDILFIRQEGKNRHLCSLSPSTGKVTNLYDFKELPVCQPARSLDGSVLVVPLPSLKRVFCLKGVKRYDSNLNQDPNIEAFPLIFPLPGESYVNLPSISRDKQLVSVLCRLYTHPGNIAVHDAATGAYDHTFVAIHRRNRLVAYKIDKTLQPQVVYYEDPQMPDLDSSRKGYCSVFSPTQDLIAYVNAGRICLCDSRSGQVMRRLTMQHAIYESSSLAFSPDGATLAYIGCRGITDTPDSVVLMDIRNGAGRRFRLPAVVRPASLVQGTGAATICLDFSPDGRYILFSGSPREGDRDSAVEMFRDLAGTAPEQVDLFILDTQTGQYSQLTRDGQSFDPVWKGR